MDIRLHACSYSLHTHPFKTSYNPPPFYLLRLQVLGFAKALVHGEMKQISPGDLLMYCPGEPYHLKVGEEGEDTESGDYFLLCDGNWIDEWWRRHERDTLKRIPLDDHLLYLWQQLCTEQHRVNRNNQEIIGHLLCTLLLTIDQVTLDSGQKQGQGSVRSNELVVKMKQYINDHALRPLRVEEVAHHVGLSVSRAVHLFKEVTGYTIIGYAGEIRLSHAIERILYTEASLESIAYSCGFGTYSYFHKCFKEKMGCSPSEFRKQPDFLGRDEQKHSTIQTISGISPDAYRFLRS